MPKNRVQSDQLYNWSDFYGTRHNESSPAKTKNTPSQASSFAGHSARFADRAIQALWQARMQMCGGTRPWPQVLPVHQSPGRRPEMDYIPAEFQEKVNTYLENYRKVKEILEELCSISRELLRRRERF